jgi:hypothetical protein
MWYREAKQGSLWSLISPTFEQDVAEAINLSTLSGVIDLDLFQKNFKNIPNNNLSYYEFRYVPKSELGEGSGAHCDRVNKEILIDENLINNLSWVKSTIKHEIIHAIENISIPNNNDELYLMPQQSRSDLFRGDWVENQEPLEVQKLRKQLEDKYYYYIVDREVNITVVEARKKAKKMADKAIRELDKRAKSIHGDFDMYFANPSELRAFRAEFDNLFSLENLKTVYHQIYENLENGKELFLSGFYELIQRIASVDDLSESYQNSFYYNLLYVADVINFDQRFNLQVINNLDPQYVRQIAKYLANLYASVKDYISSYVPDNSETEVL